MHRAHIRAARGRGATSIEAPSAPATAWTRGLADVTSTSPVLRTESARKWANERTLGSKNLRTFPCKRPTRGSENLGVSWIPKISTHNDKKWVLIRYSAHFLLHMNTPRAMVSLHELESYRPILWDFRILRHDTMAQRMRWRLCRRHTCARGLSQKLQNVTITVA